MTAHDVARVFTKYSGLSGSTNWITRNYFERGDLGAITVGDFTNFTGQLQDFWDAVAGLLPAAMGVTVQVTGEILNSETGVLERDITGTSGARTTAGTDTNAYVMGSGFRVLWTSSDILFGRHVHGSMAVVPICEDGFVNGDPSTAAVTTVQTAAEALVNNTDTGGYPLVIYSRPNAAKARLGATSLVVSATVLAIPGVLKRRRT